MSLLQIIQKYCLPFFFLVYPWHNPSFWAKDGRCPNLNYGSYYAHFGRVMGIRGHGMPLKKYAT
jgi:hypothetical protein